LALVVGATSSNDAPAIGNDFAFPEGFLETAAAFVSNVSSSVGVVKSRQQQVIEREHNWHGNGMLQPALETTPLPIR
jgi:hypothetical protein